MEPIRTYHEMLQFETYQERLKYLELRGSVGRPTFAFDRYLNQRFYTSLEWQTVRRQVLIRDMGCDLGVVGREIPFRPLVHHMNPMLPEHIVDQEDWILDPDQLITVSHKTHNAIHYGNSDNAIPDVPRIPGDTLLWESLRKESVNE